MTSKLQREGKQIRFQFLQVLLSRELKRAPQCSGMASADDPNRQFGSNIDDYQEISRAGDGADEGDAQPDHGSA
ncbi:MAG: hypothetical protein M0C28_41330 [Candidatus Moduliflexus flocculans]|nr:hypothetical protein [Candidatus Moduliflexus flocculans]